MERIDIAKQLEEFRAHLSQNPRTVFSAKFGDGKTYFLKKYINAYGKDTIYITLHPVNYVVSSNEDIFEYIKRDILSEFAMLGCVQEEVFLGILNGIFNLDNARDVIGCVAQVYLKSHKIDAPVMKTLKNINDNFKKHRNSIDDYMSEFESQRGSIYEQDAYTKVIRDTIVYLEKRDEAPKKCVLIVEDMDRLDPAHLFRILNVLGAHIDVETERNKFGFENIILVMDYDETKNIYAHFYGNASTYEGYMDKFSSSHVYRYSISRLAQKALVKKIENETEKKILDILVDGYSRQPRSKTLRNLIEELSVRKVEQIYDNIDSMWLSDTVEVNGRTISTKAPVTYLLALLTLINQPYKRYSVYELYDKAAPTLYCGQFVYAYSNIEDGVFWSDDNHQWLISPIYDGDTITGIKTIDSSAKDKTTIRGTDVLRAAWALAESVILDAEKIKMVNN